jgi:hypothetical protein
MSKIKELESKLKTLNLDELSSNVIDKDTYMESVIFSAANNSHIIAFELWTDEHVEVEASCTLHEYKTEKPLYESEGDIEEVFMGLVRALRLSTSVYKSDYHDDVLGDGSHQL